MNTYGKSVRLHKRIWWQWDLPWFWEQEKFRIQKQSKW